MNRRSKYEPPEVWWLLRGDPLRVEWYWFRLYEPELRDAETLASQLEKGYELVLRGYRVRGNAELGPACEVAALHDLGVVIVSPHAPGGVSASLMRHGAGRRAWDAVIQHHWDDKDFYVGPRAHIYSKAAWVPRGSALIARTVHVTLRSMLRATYAACSLVHAQRGRSHE